MNFRKPCEHRRYDPHPGPMGSGEDGDCPGGEFATLNDLIAAINGLEIGGVVRVSYIGPEQPPVYLDEALAHLDKRDRQ